MDANPSKNKDTTLTSFWKDTFFSLTQSFYVFVTEKVGDKTNNLQVLSERIDAALYSSKNLIVGFFLKK